MLKPLTKPRPNLTRNIGKLYLGLNWARSFTWGSQNDERTRNKIDLFCVQYVVAALDVGVARHFIFTLLPVRVYVGWVFDVKNTLSHETNGVDDNYNEVQR